jgi:hypothetical protein
MKFISYNIVAICFIALAAVFVILNRDGWGWCMLCALITTILPSSKK